MTPEIAVRVAASLGAGALLVTAALALTHHDEPRPPPPPEFTCIEPEAPPPATVVEEPVPASDTYTNLETCLRQIKSKVTVANVRYWVEVEHDPVWLENGSWWLPLSGEGEAHWPSGAYITVPIHGGTCGGAIVN